MTGFLNNGLKRLLKSSQSLLVRRQVSLSGYRRICFRGGSLMASTSVKLTTGGLPAGVDA